jgi:hypothetical protein
VGDPGVYNIAELTIGVNLYSVISGGMCKDTAHIRCPMLASVRTLVSAELSRRELHRRSIHNITITINGEAFQETGELTVEIV